VIGRGYNYLPKDNLPWNNSQEVEQMKDTKYPYGKHSQIIIGYKDIYLLYYTY